MPGENQGGQNQGGAGTGKSAELSQEQLDAIDDRMATMLNSTLASRLKGLQKAQDDKLSAFATEIKTLLSEGMKGGKGGSANEEGDDGKGGKGGKDPDRVKLTTLEARLAETNAKLEAAENRSKAERQKNRNSVLRSQVDSALQKIVGIDDADLRGLAITDLMGNGRVKFSDENDDESPIEFIGEDRVGIALEDGMRKWAKTPLAQKLIPPKGVKGAGTRPRVGNNGTPSQADKAEAQNAFWDGLAKALE